MRKRWRKFPERSTLSSKPECRISGLAHEQELLLERLMQVPNRTYLWVYLTLDFIEKEIYVDRAAITNATSSLPKTIDKTYNRILSKSHNPPEARDTLSIVTAATRPLTLDEMAMALALRGNHRSSDFSLRSNHFGDRLRHVCGLFVAIVDSKVYLLHQTAREFLVRMSAETASESVLRTLKWKHSLDSSESHRMLAEVCIRHLLEGYETQSLAQSFFYYSARSWTLHVRESNINAQEAMTDSMLKLCYTHSPCYRTWTWICCEPKDYESVFLAPKFTTLMAASYFGLEILVGHLLEMDGSNLNSRDSKHGRSALSWAAQNGFDAVARRLIRGIPASFASFMLPWRWRAKVNLKDNSRLTPLMLATLHGHETVIRLLADEGADLEIRDKDGRTALMLATWSEQEAVARLLVDKGADIEVREKNGQTALMLAAWDGNEAVVKLLLDKGADLKARDRYNHTVLTVATRMRHEGIVRLLTDKGANLEPRDEDGEMALV